MADTILARLFAHNNWANGALIDACAALSDAQLDAEPASATHGTIRRTLVHLVTAQQGYLRLLTLPLDARRDPVTPPPFAAARQLADASGAGLLALARDEARLRAHGRIETQDGYCAEPWVIMVATIQHATEHREQIGAMLSALGVTPPKLDGWRYGEATGDLIPIAP